MSRQKKSDDAPKIKHRPRRIDEEEAAVLREPAQGAPDEDRLRELFQEFLAKQAMEQLPAPEEPTRKVPSKSAKPLGDMKTSRLKPAEPAPADEQQFASEPSSGTSRQRTGSRRPKRAGLLSFRLPLPVALALILASALVAFTWARSLGVAAGLRQAEEERTKRNVPLDDETIAAIDDALQLMQEERFTEAIDAFAAIQKANPEIGSLSFLQGVAAIRTDNTELAEEKIRESIARDERVSDAVALLAILEAKQALDTDYRTMGSPAHRISGLLESSIASDPVSSRPFYEMGTLLRFQKDWDDARSQFESALLRLSPVDSYLSISLAKELTALQALPDDELPPIAEQGN
jgi:tetratricopeptide (TPR) repeat protein